MVKKTLRASIIIFFYVISSSSILGIAFGADKPFTFGLLMVGSHEDHGRSQTYFEAGKYVEEKIPNTKMIYIDKVNPTDRPGMTIPLLVDDMVQKGARLIITSTDDMKDGVREAALQHPDIHFVHISGDDVLTKKAPKNLSNLMSRMEYGKMMAGFAAGLTTKTGKIGYLGPLINEETLRFASSAYLGAKYAWEKVLNKDPKDLKFQVIWIGWWINLPDVTEDPTKVAHNFFNTGFDVVISGIDTNEVLTVADQKRKEGKIVWAVGSNNVDACKDVAEVCLGAPIFNWRPGYVQFIKAARSGKWKSEWLFLGPDWKNINNSDTSSVKFVDGPALSPSAKSALNAFIKDLGSGKLNLFKGPLNYQDGKPFLKTGETASVNQIWYIEQLLEGMSGQSRAKKSD